MPCIEKEEKQYQLVGDVCEMLCMNFWLGKLVFQVRQRNEKSYCPEMLHQVCCGLLYLLKEVDRAEVNIEANPMFVCFWK